MTALIGTVSAVSPRPADTAQPGSSPSWTPSSRHSWTSPRQWAGRPSRHLNGEVSRRGPSVGDVPIDDHQPHPNPNRQTSAVCITCNADYPCRALRTALAEPDLPQATLMLVSRWEPRNARVARAILSNPNCPDWLEVEMSLVGIATTQPFAQDFDLPDVGWWRCSGCGGDGAGRGGAIPEGWAFVDDPADDRELLCDGCRPDHV